MLQSPIFWGLLPTFVMVIFYFRFRSSIERLTRTLRDPREGFGVKNLRRGLTPSYVYNLAREIERQREIEKERVREELEQQELIDSILDEFEHGFLVVGEDMTVKYANKAAREHFAQVKNILGRGVIEAFLDHRIQMIVKRSLEDQLHVDQTIRLQQRVERRGEMMQRVLEVESAPLPSPLRGYPGAWVILRDESERYHTEQVRRDFVANASHEIRTPLSIICGYLENLASEEVVDPEMVRRFYGVMQKHAQRLERIVEDMLSISKLEGNPEALVGEPFDLIESALDMVEHLQPLIQEKGAKVMVTSKDGDRSIFGDRVVWDQIFFNLIENVLKQNSQKGLEIEIRIAASGQQHRVEVIDNGVGIPGPHLTHVFKRFYRVERHHAKGEVAGTGLGLSIVKRGVEAHGGQIQLSSIPGKETRFSIAVPRVYLGTQYDKNSACTAEGID